MVYMDKNLKSSTFNENGYYGWGVLSCYPWHLHGVYSSQKKAEKIAKMLSCDYSVFYGVYFPLRGEFVPEHY
ncbi:hypothetical protein JBL72_004614 [Salmonella enterica]|uniref:hypothetical protein n=1 Tax=Escherichia coli TaxID=562 RepID=UPI0002A3937D|nr:hypothetical protein [Escherichia coli]EGT2545641.1 hypothetical protein [Salmonella enterica]ELG95085.1 hypothetical protein A313_00100 [Escherichia coli KTE147]HDD9401259.1 hypothetical protein [Escherichia coli]